jgi:hypothetical protein
VTDETQNEELETPTGEAAEVESPQQTDDTGDAPASAVSAKLKSDEQATDPKPGDEKKSLSDLMSEAIDSADNRKKTAETPEAKAEREKAAAEAATKEEAEAAKKGQVRGADGKFREMTPEEKAAKEAAAAAEAAKAAKPDHINDPIPKDINARTAERMTALVNDVKALQAVQKDHNDLMGYINGTGASPQEFSQALNYMRAIRSNDPKMLEAAYAQLQSELLGLSERMGKPIPEVNLLRDPKNADLVKEIQDGKLTVQRAHELALWRSRQARESTTRTTAETTQAKERERAQVLDVGKNELNALEDTLIAKDGEALYRAKTEIVYAALEPVFASIDPRNWKATFQAAYDKLKLQAPAAPAAPAPTARPTPLRPKAPAAGGAQGAPKSALEAVSAALEGM